LHSISGSRFGDYTDAAERTAGKIMGDLNYGSVDEFLAGGMHESLDHLQDQFNNIGEAIFESYVLMPHVIDSPVKLNHNASTIRAWKHQQEQQQQ
jgi:uncharacterized alpha-E superfamily protein